jgi:hypothetical protein
MLQAQQLMLPAQQLVLSVQQLMLLGLQHKTDKEEEKKE